jgi:hypothetical protein
MVSHARSAGIYTAPGNLFRTGHEERLRNLEDECGPIHARGLSIQKLDRSDRASPQMQLGL